MINAIAFVGSSAIAKGPLDIVAVAAKAALDQGVIAPVLIFDSETSRVIDVDFSGNAEDVRARLNVTGPEVLNRGRPKLGVVAREVTLLPRHWAWLATQRGGASGAIRRLVDEARRGTAVEDSLRQGQEALYRFITAMAGDAPGYEEATRALFSGDAAGFKTLSARWAPDVQAHALALSQAAFAPAPGLLVNIIPEKWRAAVAQALSFTFPGESVVAVDQMTWGATGAEVFKVTIGKNIVVVRLESLQDSFRDPARQYACARIAADAGLAPPLIYADSSAHLSISNYVAASPTKPPLSRADQIIALTGAVKRLHLSPLFPPLTDYFTAMDGILAQFSASGIAPNDLLNEAMDLYSQISAVYPRDGDLVSSHNDLNPSNIIFEAGRPWIVDWESAFAADAYVDLAAIANFYAPDEVCEELVLTTYFGDRLDERVRSRFFLMQQVNRLFYAAMLIGAAAKDRPDLRLSDKTVVAARLAHLLPEMASLATIEGRLRFGCGFLNEVLHQRRSPRFAASLAIIRALGR